MDKLSRKKVFLNLVFLIFSLGHGAAFSEVIHKTLPLYLYSDFGLIEKHHFYPVGKMGDTADVSLIENCSENPAKGETCISIRYTPHKEASWAGIYWLYPPNNWGFIPETGYDLRGAKRFSFYAKGKKGGERINFTIGGVSGQYGDTALVQLEAVVLTAEWREYTLDLSKSDMSRIIGGFSFSIQYDLNPFGIEFYLDELRYE